MPARTFVPEILDTSSADALAAIFAQLEARPINSPADLERWLLDCSEFGAVLSESGAQRYIDMTCHTDDKAAEAAYLHFIEKISPATRPLSQKLDQKFLASPHRTALPKHRYEVFDRNTANDVALFRQENIPLQTEEARLDQQQAKIAGAQTVYFDGKLRTIPQMFPYMEETDRRLRQFAWETMTTRRLANEAEFDDLLDKQIAARDQIAKNAGLPSFVEYAFRMYRRFDYTPADCFAFHDAIEKTCVPLLRQIQEHRRQTMKFDTLRPWDTAVDTLGRPPLRPFEGGLDLAQKTERIIARLDQDLAAELTAMREQNLLDLDSRPNKAPGGYQSTLDERRVPFIFMNAAGTHGDLQTLLHEAGHAFHANASRNDPLIAYRSAPIEFCEVASMGMELIAGPWLSEVYTPEQHARALRQHLEGIIALLPWIATVDAFQHWIYKNPRHSHEQRNAFWLTLMKRFGGITDYSGYEHALETSWQRQRHLWNCAFYYVEYGIAQLGALQLWANSLQDPKAALAAYKKALALGGSRPLPELFAAANLKFDFTHSTLAPLMTLVQKELARLPP
ncbi:MAG TPA: M3 family oligoendopeptidase [Phycisphaerae bacterium]|nr:M3 family oligoendopeptidase [Phycisphaerae bacterium]